MTNLMPSLPEGRDGIFYEVDCIGRSVNKGEKR